MVWLKSADTPSIAEVLIRVFETSRRRQDHAYLLFNSYGDQHFLSQIWSASDKAGTELPESSAERELVRSRPQGQVNKGLAPKLVMIAAR